MTNWTENVGTLYDTCPNLSEFWNFVAKTSAVRVVSEKVFNLVVDILTYSVGRNGTTKHIIWFILWTVVTILITEGQRGNLLCMQYAKTTVLTEQQKFIYSLVTGTAMQTDEVTWFMT